MVKDRLRKITIYLKANYIVNNKRFTRRFVYDSTVKSVLE